MSKKVNRNDADFSSIEISSENVHRIDVDFWLIEITPKEYFEMLRKLVDILFSTNSPNINIQARR